MKVSYELSKNPKPMNNPIQAVAEVPTRGRLLAIVALALLVATLALVLVVLPAEYRIDPTGAGRILGLDRLRAKPGSEPMALAPAETAQSVDKPYSSETVTIQLGAREQMEFKIGMVQGKTIVFSWDSGGQVLYADFHGEPYNDLEQDPVRYEERDGISSWNGALTAPFSGLHGWYWRNEAAVPVEITLRVSGFFTHFKDLGHSPVVEASAG